MNRPSRGRRPLGHTALTLASGTFCLVQTPAPISSTPALTGGSASRSGTRRTRLLEKNNRTSSRLRSRSSSFRNKASSKITRSTLSESHSFFGWSMHVNIVTAVYTCFPFPLSYTGMLSIPCPNAGVSTRSFVLLSTKHMVMIGLICDPFHSKLLCFTRAASHEKSLCERLIHIRYITTPNTVAVLSNPCSRRPINPIRKHHHNKTRCQ